MGFASLNVISFQMAEEEEERRCSLSTVISFFSDKEGGTEAGGSHLGESSCAFHISQRW